MLLLLLLLFVQSQSDDADDRLKVGGLFHAPQSTLNKVKVQYCDYHFTFVNKVNMYDKDFSELFI